MQGAATKNQDNGAKSGAISENTTLPKANNSKRWKRKKETVQNLSKATEGEATSNSEPKRNNGLLKETPGTPTTNAFQLMMDSRHKSIGRNSPGREVASNGALQNSSDQETQRARKRFLKNWAELKGASKRKREYDEVGNYINQKLQKRARKMKRMLKANSYSGEDVTIRRATVAESDHDRGISTIEVHSDKLEENENSTTVKEGASSSKNCLEVIELDTEACDVDSAKLSETSEVVAVEKEDCSEKRVLRTRKVCPNIYNDEVWSTFDEGNSDKRKKPTKVAAVFLKSVPKKKLDPDVAKARRQFLLSGIPSSLKKEIEKQQCVEEYDFDVFPAVSHVQQKSTDQLWNLKKAELNLIFCQPVHVNLNSWTRLLKFADCKKPNRFEQNTLLSITSRVKLLSQIKSQHPDYPVDKISKIIFAKSGYKAENNPQAHKNKIKTKRKTLGRKKRNVEVIIDAPTKLEENVYATWTEKYTARTSEEIIGNQKAVASLKQWLKDRSKEESSKKKYDSESEFDTTDGDSRDSTNSQGNAVLLKGPYGSGKTAAVYAICNELGLNVLEVNASSKRTGKRLQQELQEATRSHQVAKTENTLKLIKEHSKKSSERRICVLLVEDVDVVFEHDEGFLTVLTQIMNTTKRPIILTTSENSSAHIKNIVGVKRVISFLPLSSLSIPWLQTVCLAEGCYVKATSIEDILHYNRGDIRRTLLQLQFWVSSHGQSNNFDHKDHDNCDGTEWNKEISEESVPLHFTFAPADDYGTFSFPHLNDFEVIWWNIPHILNFSQSKIETKSDKQQLRTVCDLYDSLSFAEVACGKGQFHEMLQRRWQTKPKDSLALDENLISYTDNFNSDLVHSLICGKIKIYKEKYVDVDVVSTVNFAVPGATEQRCYSKQVAGEMRLQEALQHTVLLDRKCVALDYMPTLRAIDKSEAARAATSTKRRNRFYNYLKTLNVSNGYTGAVFKMD